jgi:hypothetical protein
VGVGLVRRRSLFLWSGVIAALAVAAVIYLILNSQPTGKGTAAPPATSTDKVAKQAGATVTPTTPPLAVEPK